MDCLALYELAYALAARDGRHITLFGNGENAAREAFLRCLTGDTFPELWFELPLTGEPWFDFHALTSYETVAGTQARFAGHSGVYADALNWFAAQEPHTVRQLALSYDTSTNDAENPAVQLLMEVFNTPVTLDFLKAAGRPDLVDAYRTFVGNIPTAWYPCYIGVFPQRGQDGKSPWLRVECILDEACQDAYACDGDLLRNHLAGVGLEEFDDDIIPGVQMLAQLPFQLEFQFNIDEQGKALPVLSASLRFQSEDFSDQAKREQIVALLKQLQDKGLADERWRLIIDTLFVKRVTHKGESVVLSSIPTFVKLRWRKGLAPDAKAYLMVQAQGQDTQP